MSQSQVPPTILCPSPVLPPGAQGIARVAVADGLTQLIVTFLNPVTPQQSYLCDRLSYSLTGGRRLFPRILKADPYPPTSPPSSPPGGSIQSVLLTLDTPGDFSIYTLTVTGPDIDPFFSSAKLRFRLACDDFFDCLQPTAPPSQPPELPVAIDYLAKDYAGFRQALLDFIPTRLPAWTERSESDIGMMLLELFSATADNLSYTQDRIANEAFLSTATQRRSVAGHLALIGYQMDEGASAYTWIQFQVKDPQQVRAGFKVSNDPSSRDDPVIVFETMTAVTLDPVLNAMSLYDWGNRNCCLPKEACSAALVGSFDRVLRMGDYLLFDNGSGQRDIVRLVESPKVYQARGVASPPVASPPGSPPDVLITMVAWSDATPLRSDYCIDDTTVRGNVVPATHGERIQGETLRPAQTAGGKFGIAALSHRIPRLRLRLQRAPLAHMDPQVFALGAPLPWYPSEPKNSAAEYTKRDQRTISTLQINVENDLEPWVERATLLDSGPDEKVFRVEIDDGGEATVVFGNGTFGQTPPENAAITATYRVGGGAVGNVGAETLTRAYPESAADWLLSVTNPMPATGGRDMESRDHARRVGPQSFHQSLVAVSAVDYQDIAASFADSRGRPAIQRANATFRWTGSWLTVTLTVDPAGGESLTPDLRQNLLDYLETKRLTGYDLTIVPPVDLPVDLAIQFVAAEASSQSDIQQALLQALSNADLPDGSKGFFHPDNFTFGQNLYVSRIYEAVLAVPGVQSARITRLAQSHAAEPDKETEANLARSFLAVGLDQVIRLDNDPNFPQNGTLTIFPRGVRT